MVIVGSYDNLDMYGVCRQNLKNTYIILYQDNWAK